MHKTLFILSIITVAFSSCKKKGCTDEDAINYNSEAEKDDGSCAFYNIPSSYIFTDYSNNNTVSYSGQTDRLNQMDEFVAYMYGGTSAALDAGIMKDMFYNTADNGGGNFSFSSSKQLANKCFPSDSAEIVSWIDSLAIASIDFATTASNGQAGTLTSGSNTFLVSANGFEYQMLLEIGIMGAVMLYQANSVYFGDGKMNVDNTVAVDADNGKYYTEMEHHWDEAFGYFGAPTDFPENLTGIRYWAKSCNSRNAVLGSNAVMMNGFLHGRTAIVNNDLTERDAQISTIRNMWERMTAMAAKDYLVAASNNIGDQALLLHYLSKAYAYIKCLTYVDLSTRTITFTQIQNLLNSTLGGNLWNVNATAISNAINEIDTIYQF